MSGRREWDFMALTPAGAPESGLAIAGSRAGALGVLNLEFAHDQAVALAELDRLVTHGRGRLGVLLDPRDEWLASAVLDFPGLDTFVLTSSCPERLPVLIDRIHGLGRRAF